MPNRRTALPRQKVCKIFKIKRLSLYFNVQTEVKDNLMSLRGRLVCQVRP